MGWYGLGRPSRARVRPVVNARLAPAPPAPKPTAAPAKPEEFFWGKVKPAGMKEGDKVMPGVIKKAVDEDLLDLADEQGFVAIGGDTYVVEKKETSAPPRDGFW